MSQSLEAERGLLGCCLLDGQDSASLAERAGITAASFTHALNGQIFGTMLELLSQGNYTTPDSVVLTLSEKKLLDGNGSSYVNQLARDACTTLNLRLFISRIRADELARRVNRAGGELKELSEQDRIEADELICDAQDTLSRALDWKSVDNRSWRARVQELLSDKQLAPQAEISFGLSDFDRDFVPMGPGQLVIIAARPGTGKSSLMRQIVSHHAARSKRIFLASLEMTVEEIVCAMAATKIGFSQRDAQIHAREQFRTALGEIGQWPLEIMDQFGASIDAIIDHIRVEHRRSPFSLVCIDHLHALRDSLATKGINATDAISRVTKLLKALAGELRVPVMLLAQLSRLSERETRRPRLDDLRGSGSIEEDADKVIFLHRPEINPITKTAQPISSPVQDTPRFLIEAIQAKGRGHGTAEVPIYFQRPITRFEQIARS
jgi:replicative DNA helicase